ncbi:hypothetical protein G4V39_07310 [Thermosulfuriphilus ammonigenes]|uniref:Uncharacterized protein n=1 Tax=Thermosulfuriphilus ammonigenes TaxID=1936021 RepID=A0A6G7PX07_9BACT|nr:hypothetical protein [Thermosulfuriphilus ammonigenes]MBA2847707.1 hypothetical protein [Thermosulfuriphilus ammonigenes]QIJ72086.1 hypothetical protein G4V39_07310 [Thermosulfuriphilus ammonigenes]
MLVKKIGSSEITILPALHGNLEFAWVVGRRLRDLAPEAIAVEFPPTLKDKIIRAVKRLPFLSVVTYENSQGQIVYLLVEPCDPFIEAVRTALEREIPVFFIDRDTEGYPDLRDPVPDPYALGRIGYDGFCWALIERGFERTAEDELREKTMAYHLKELAKDFKKVAFVCGLAHAKAVYGLLNDNLAHPLERLRRQGVRLYSLDRLSAREVLSEPAFIQAAYERARETESRVFLDRLELYDRLLEAGRKRHLRVNKERLSLHSLQVLSQFARNYALVSGRLTPDLYQLLVACRGAAGDDFAWEVFQEATEYPFFPEKDDLVPLRITLDDLDRAGKRIRFFRRLRGRRHLSPVRRPRERVPGEWKRSFTGVNICSFPPEDIVVEGFGRRLRQQALHILSEDRRLVEPFTVSMRDGLDLRETIRNFYQDRLYVYERPTLQGKVGSVVVIFDPDEKTPEAFPWRLTWLGEHDQESDMAFYATPAGEVVVGPGISRCHYGGFMLTYPPQRVYPDIWEDPYFDIARDKPERLLLAAIDYSLEKFIVYIARRPPSERAKSFARRLGRQVVYFPLGQFSPSFLKKIRTFHVLDGHHVRLYAHRYIDH